jgi:hypothetical protein
MAVEATLTIGLRVSQTSQSPASGGGIYYETTDTDTWSSGQASGEVDQAYRVLGTLAASGTVTYNLLAAGALEDAFGNVVDLDELKGFVVKCLTGAIKVTRASANGVPCFTSADEGAVLAAGHTFGFNFGPGGLALGSTASLTVTETSTTLGATFELLLVGAE